MPQLSSKLTTPAGNEAVAVTTAGHKIGGVVLQFPAVADLNTAITGETANVDLDDVGYSFCIWDQGTLIRVSAESPGVLRQWDREAATPNALTAILPNASLITLAANTNTIISTDGTPDAGDGADGDYAFDPATSTLYGPKATTWPSGTVLFSGTPPAGSVTNSMIAADAAIGWSKISKSGAVKGDVGLGNVDNTSDLEKRIAIATREILRPNRPLAPDVTPTIRLLSDCSDINMASIVGTDATVESDSTYVRHGTASYKVTNASTGNTELNIFIPPFSAYAKELDGSTLDGLGLWVYFPNAVTITSLTYSLSSSRSGGAGTKKSATVGLFEGKFVSSSPTTGGWNFIYLEIADLTGGTLDLTDNSKPITNINIQCVNKPGEVWYVDSVLWGCKAKSKFTFTFDDAYEPVYTEIFPIFESLNDDYETNLKGTVYYCGSLNGTAGYLTTEQLQTLENAGWVIANHTYSHYNPSSYTTPTQVETWTGDFGRNDKWLSDQGLHSGRAHMAFPNGNCVLGTHDYEMKRAGIKSARILNGGVLTNAYIDGPAHPFCLMSKGVTKTTSAATIIDIIDDLVEAVTMKNRWMMMYFHTFGTSAEEAAGTIVWDRDKMYNGSNYLDDATVIGNVANKIIAGTLEHKTIVEMENYIAKANALLPTGYA